MGTAMMAVAESEPCGNCRRVRETPKTIAVESTSQTLCMIYSMLRNHFGYTHPWWPGTPLEIMISAILVQRCNWSTAWNGVNQLRSSDLLSLPTLAHLEIEAVDRCLRGVSLSPKKSRWIVRLAQALLERGYESVEEYFATSQDTAILRADLLGLDGIGEETADCILCFASEHPSFVVDASARRLFERLDVFPDLDKKFWAGPSLMLKEFIEQNILADLSLYDAFEFNPGIPRAVALFRDFHAQIVEVGKHHCLSRNPCCETRGKNGWADYAFCESHCNVGNCSSCPLIKACSRRL